MFRKGKYQEKKTSVNTEKVVEKKTKQKKQKIEWSKFIASILIVYGISCGILYYIAIFNNKSPDSALAVQSVITIMGAFGEYLLYQASLKVSRNRHNIDSEGIPFDIASITEKLSVRAASNISVPTNIDTSLDNASEKPLENEHE